MRQHAQSTTSGLSSADEIVSKRSNVDYEAVANISFSTCAHMLH